MNFGKFINQIFNRGTPSSGYVKVVDDATGDLYEITSISRSANTASAIEGGDATGGTGLTLIHITIEQL